MNEGLSITENLAQIGVKISGFITDRLHVIENEAKKQTKKMNRLLDNLAAFSINIKETMKHGKHYSRVHSEKSTL